MGQGESWNLLQNLKANSVYKRTLRKHIFKGRITMQTCLHAEAYLPENNPIKKCEIDERTAWKLFFISIKNSHHKLFYKIAISDCLRVY